MASRESQGLQIALILFVMVTVVLAVTTYFFFRKAEEKTKQAAAARDEVTQFENAAKQTDFENQVLKHVIGVAPKTDGELETIMQGLGGKKEIAQVLADFKEHKAMYGAGFDETKQSLNYVTLPAHLIDQINRRNRDLTDLDETIKKLEDDKDRIRNEEQARIKKVQDDYDKAQVAYAAQVTAFGAERTRLTAMLKTETDKIPVKNAKISEIEAKMATEIGQRDTELRSLRESEALARAELDEAMKPQEFERPDGQISYVNQRDDMVWIDLGSADGVKRQMSFSVYDQNQVGATNAEIKASIQVTAVTEPHMAEARILEHELSNPIMKGDKIYSPTFRRGEKIRFALAGFLDIDGDGKSDQKKVASIITINGGQVDAQLMEDGSLAGKIELGTRYLVMGDRPTDRTDQQLMDGWNRMLDDATNMGLETMALAELLGRMGYRDDSRVTNLQRGGPGGSGEAKSFRKRLPSTKPSTKPSTTRSAYP